MLSSLRSESFDSPPGILEKIIELKKDNLSLTGRGFPSAYDKHKRNRGS